MSLLSEFNQIEKKVEHMISDVETLHDTLWTIKRKANKEVKR